MIVIIEGMDRCGKSTLIGNLRKYLMTKPTTLVHHSSAPPKGLDDPNGWEVVHYSDMFKLAQDLQLEGWDIIFDRLHLGAVVYGQKYRGMDPERIYKVDAFYMTRWRAELANEFALILLTDYPEEISKRDDGLGLEKDLADLENTRTSFLAAYDRSLVPHRLHINISDNGGFENTLPTVISFLLKMRAHNDAARKAN